MFSKQNTLRWVEYARPGANFQWIGTEENDFIPPILGEPFPDIYPFRKFIVSTDAPVFTNSLGFTNQGPPSTVVNVKVAFQKGKVFDLFKVEKLINRPVIVLKLEDGKYRIIKTNGAIDYTENQLEQFCVPVILNGREMVDVDPNNIAAATDSTLTLQLRFNNLGALPTPVSISGGANEGTVFLMLKKRPSSNTTPPDPRYYQQIIGAEIVSFIQLRQRGAVTNGVINENHPYVKDRRRIVLLDLCRIMTYRGVGSVESILAAKGNFQPENYGGFIEKAVVNSATERTTQVLTLVGGGALDVSEENFSDHLFTRIL